MKSTLRLNTGSGFWLLFAAGAIFLACFGCDSNTESGFATSDEEDEKSLVKPEPLKLLAIGVPDFGKEITRQWAAEREGELEVEHVSLDQFDSDEELPEDFDLIVHPASIAVDLISRNAIRIYPRDSLLSPEMNLEAYLTHFRKSLVRHDDKTWSVSLGGHQLRLFYRKDVLAAGDIEPPKTWNELNRAIEKLKDVEEAKDLAPIALPRSNSMAGQMFLARVACLIRKGGKLTSFFDRKTMAPKITAPPFEEALNELKSLYAACEKEFSVAGAFGEFADSRAVFAIAWPVGDFEQHEDLESKSLNWGVSQLPGSDRYYDLKESRWHQRSGDDGFNVDVLGITANNVSITTGTSNAKDASDFVVWLTDKSNGQKLLQDVAAPFRATHLARIGKWYRLENANREFLDMFADSIDDTHKSKIFLMFPQLKEKRNYLEVLDDAVAEFLDSDDGDAKKTLQQVSDKWEALTDSIGRQRQINDLRNGNSI